MYCYKFESKEHFRSLAAAEGLITTDEDGNEHLTTCTHDFAIDEVGIISRGGEWDPETGEVITPPTVLDGWHINTLGLSPKSWDQYLCIVNHPSRVFAGGDTQVPPTPVLEEITTL